MIPRTTSSAALRLLQANASHTLRSTRWISSSQPPQRPEPAYEGHIPLNWFENAFLAVGSAFASLSNPRRGDMVAALGETTAGPALPRLRDIMLQSAEGRSILRDRPRVTSDTVNMDQLRTMPENSFGRTYIEWLEQSGVTPDTREPVHYVSDPELAYVMQRYRDCHDFYHTICFLPVSVPAELTLKFFEFANLGLPSTALSALFGPLRLNSEQLMKLWKEDVPWALKCGGGARCLIDVYWEKRWEMDVGELRKELRITSPPPVVWPPPLSEAKKARRKREALEREAAANV